MGRALLVFLLTIGVSVGSQAMPVVPVEPLALWLEDEPLANTTANGPVSLAQAREMAVTRFPGRVVRAETVGGNGRRVHHIRILAGDGRVRTVRVDAQTGAFL